MIKILLPYYDKLVAACVTAEQKEEMTTAKAHGMSEWQEYEIKVNEVDETTQTRLNLSYRQPMQISFKI